MSDQKVSDELVELIRNHASVAKQEKQTHLGLVTHELDADQWRRLRDEEKAAQARLIEWKPATPYDALIKLSYLLRFSAERGRPLHDASLAIVLNSVNQFDPGG
ncbi:hypothetical protein [Ensifer sp. YR511]|uniref:hypothetical protein n=1 Tax=Ensifer sp. YR511 TaxID=1855294 RepID=UPI00088BF2D0|nr:hypothetical protein [Ensifer sp. YR511]SDN95962.1 hypothetical protein SAMN05216328_14436 [Ensifer sp. YR511]